MTQAWLYVGAARACNRHGLPVLALYFLAAAARERRQAVAVTRLAVVR